MFDVDGQFVYFFYDVDEDGWFGDIVLINGVVVFFVVDVFVGKVWLCLFNGVNVCFYVVVFVDNCIFYKIVIDGGLLEVLVLLMIMEILLGECCEIIVDLLDVILVELLILFEDDVDVVEEGIINNFGVLLGVFD